MNIPDQINIDGLNSSINKLTEVIEKSLSLSEKNTIFSETTNKMNTVISKVTETLDIITLKANNVPNHLTILTIALTCLIAIFGLIGFFVYKNGKDTARKEAKIGIQEFLKDYKKQLTDIDNLTKEMKTTLTSLSMNLSDSLIKTKNIEFDSLDSSENINNYNPEKKEENR